MFRPQQQEQQGQQSSLASLPSFFYTLVSDFNMLFPQPVPPDSPPAGTESSASNPHMDSQTPARNCSSPDVPSQSCPNPFSDAEMINSFNTNSSVSISKAVESWHRDGCGIDCNSRDVFHGHECGKKHEKSFAHSIPTIITLGASDMVIEEAMEIKQGELVDDGLVQPALIDERMETKQEKLMNGSLVVQPALVHEAMETEQMKLMDDNVVDQPALVNEPMETKREKLIDDSSVVRPAIKCTLCNVLCNSQTMLEIHLSGRKHGAKVAKRHGIVSDVTNPAVDMNTNATDSVPFEHLFCEICEIYCNSHEVLIKHRSGKKHLRNLEKLEKLKKENDIVGPTENPEATNGGEGIDENKRKAAKSQALQEELESKKQKIVKSGAGADAVRVCKICNVVCNSPMVFDSHLAGQKHARKLAMAG